MLTHCGGLTSLAERAGLGRRNLVSLMLGLEIGKKRHYVTVSPSRKQEMFAKTCVI